MAIITIDRTWAKEKAEATKALAEAAEAAGDHWEAQARVRAIETAEIWA